MICSYIISEDGQIKIVEKLQAEIIAERQEKLILQLGWESLVPGIT
jgi:hypothetical protein